MKMEYYIGIKGQAHRGAPAWTTVVKWWTWRNIAILPNDV